MDELFERLEARIKTLIQKVEHSKHINIKLRQNRALLAREKEMLIEKNKAAISQIEHMVLRLKTLEESQT